MEATSYRQAQQGWDTDKAGCSQLCPGLGSLATTSGGPDCAAALTHPRGYLRHWHLTRPDSHSGTGGGACLCLIAVDKVARVLLEVIYGSCTVHTPGGGFPGQTLARQLL